MFWKSWRKKFLQINQTDDEKTLKKRFLIKRVSTVLYFYFLYTKNDKNDEQEYLFTEKKIIQHIQKNIYILDL